VPLVANLDCLSGAAMARRARDVTSRRGCPTRIRLAMSLVRRASGPPHRSQGREIGKSHAGHAIFGYVLVDTSEFWMAVFFKARGCV
jgi:hypothetical protein